MRVYEHPDTGVRLTVQQTPDDSAGCGYSVRASYPRVGGGWTSIAETGNAEELLRTDGGGWAVRGWVLVHMPPDTRVVARADLPLADVAYAEATRLAGYLATVTAAVPAGQVWAGVTAHTRTQGYVPVGAAAQ